LRIIGTVASATGYVAARIAIVMRRIDTQLRPMRGWRTVDAAGIRIRIPRGWGEAEGTPSGGLVIHNRPRHARIDGDAVWYGSAIELHVERGRCVHDRGGAMTVSTRTLGDGTDHVTLALCVARGVSPAQRRIAELVFASARLGGPAAPVPHAPSDIVTPLAHPRVATVPLRPALHVNNTSGSNLEGEGL